MDTTNSNKTFKTKVQIDLSKCNSNQESVTDDIKYALQINLESLKDNYRAKWISEIEERNQILKQKRDRWNVDVG